MKKPDWVESTWGATYDDIIKSWGYEVLDMTRGGSYQGDIVVLLKDTGRYGYTVIGYGSCSGCDELESLNPYSSSEEADWTDVIRFANTLKSSITWFPSALMLADHLESLDEANHWWLHDDDLKKVVDGYIKTLRDAVEESHAD